MRNPRPNTLDFEVAWSKKSISLYQRNYTLDLLQDTGLLATNHCSIPMDPIAKLHKTSSTPLANSTSYRRLIGRILYLIHTRPNVFYVVSPLANIYMWPPMVLTLTPRSSHFLLLSSFSVRTGMCFIVLPIPWDNRAYRDGLSCCLRKIQAGVLHLMPISSWDQIDNILIKPLHIGTVKLLHSKLGLNNIHHPAWGGVNSIFV